MVVSFSTGTVTYLVQFMDREQVGNSYWTGNNGGQLLDSEQAGNCYWTGTGNILGVSFGQGTSWEKL